MMTAFILGAFIAALLCAFLWDDWQFRWTLRHGLRADLFTMTPEEVRDELSFVVRHRAALEGSEPSGDAR